MAGMLQIITYLLAFYLVVKGFEILQIALASNREKRAGTIVLGVIVLVACIVAGLAFVGMQDRQASSIGSSPLNESSMQPDYEPSGQAGEPPKQADAGQGLEVTEFNWRAGKGFEPNYLVGIVRNDSGRQYSYVQVDFNLYDERGVQITSRSANVNNLEPYGEWRFEIRVPEENVTNAKLKGVSGR